MTLDQEFLHEQLGLIRREFYRGKSERTFFQERDLLSQAVTFPAARLKQRYGVTAKAKWEVKKLFDLYSRILLTVMTTIRQHGKVAKIERFSVYFLHAVQTHMDHHGEAYYQSAKAARSAGELMPSVVGNVRIGEQESSAVEVLIGVHDALKSRGGRKKTAAPVQRTLF